MGGVSPSPVPDRTNIAGRALVASLVILLGAWLDRPQPQEPSTEHPPLFADDDAAIRPYGPAPRDRGGAVSDYVLKVFYANVRRQRVEIRGTCISACTLFLGAREVCDAMLWFHAAYNPDDRRIDAGATHKMSLYWGPQIAKWASLAGVHESTAFTRRRALSGEQAIRLGVRECKAPGSSQ